jgi:adenylate cyclase class 2
LGAKKVFDGKTISYIFDFPDNKLKNNSELLRLRKEGDKIRLTYKKMLSRDKFKEMEETEIFVSNLENIKQILTKIGLEEKKSFSKKRISFKLKGYSFEIDTYEGIPPFLEIEAESHEKVVEMAEKLGFKKEQLKPWIGPQLVKFYGKDF